MNMDMLYKYLGLTKTQIKLHQNQSSCAKTRWKNSKYKFKSGSKTVNLLMVLSVFWLVLNIQTNEYPQQRCFARVYARCWFLGSSRPSLGFILVVKMMFVTKQRMAGWQTILILIKTSQVTNKVFKATANVDLFPDLKIDLTLDRAYSQNSSDSMMLQRFTILDHPRHWYFFLFLRCWLKLHFRLVMKIHLQHLVILDQTDWQWQIDWHKRGIDINNPVNLMLRDILIYKTIRPFTACFLAAYSGNADDVSLGICFHSKLVYKIQWFDALWHL
jgi:hypothetical protein